MNQDTFFTLKKKTCPECCGSGILLTTNKKNLFNM